jgi:cell division protein FtsB
MNAQSRLMAALTEQNETLIAEVARLNREIARLREPQQPATKEK